MITPPAWPTYAEKNLKKNNTFVQFFSATLEQQGPEAGHPEKDVFLR